MEIKKLVENINIEFKLMESGKIPNSFFETYSAFANTCGGDVYFGIKEVNHKVSEIIGINNIEKFKFDLFNSLNNVQKVSQNILSDSDISVIDINGVKIVKVSIKEMSRTEKPIYLRNNPFECYKRNNEGDYRMSQSEVLSMFNDRSKESDDQKLNAAGLSFDDVNKSSFLSFRNIYNASNPNNMYMGLSDYDFALKIGILKKDNDGKFLLTNAAVLLFTDYSKILMVYPSYFIDYQENITNTARWDYRLVSDDMKWSGNLFDYFVLVLDRLKQFVSEKFIINHMIDVSDDLMNNAIREALVNALSNADYLADNPIIIKKQLSRIVFKNSGKPLVNIEQMKKGGTTLPRNREITRYFRLIKFSERSGNGVPTIIESFRKMEYIIPLIYEQTNPDSMVLEMHFEKLSDSDSKLSYNEIYSYIALRKQGATQHDLINFFQTDPKTIRKYLEVLLSRGVIATNGKKTKGKLYFVRNN